MDLINIQANTYNGYNWIQRYQDHLTKFSYLTSIEEKTVKSVVTRCTEQLENKEKG
jgi:hypothetical protein